MAEGDDQASKTEEPTEKRREEAAKKGDQPRSQDFKHWMMLASSGLAMALFAAWLTGGVSNAIRRFLTAPHEFPSDGNGILLVARAAIEEIGIALSLPVLVLVLGAIGGNALQVRPRLTFEKIKPQLSKISPMAGLKRLFSANTLVEFLKTLAKFAIVISAVVVVVWPHRDRLETMPTLSLQQLVNLIETLGLRMLLAVVLVMAFIAAVDLAFQRMQHTKKLRMTKQEVKDEHKQSDGDPKIKAQLRKIRMERSRRRMMAAVPEADVVITNPTHYAVALEYKHGEMDVPRVVAKGVEEVALRIRMLAREHHVPILENPPLARTLHAAVDIDEEIPPEHYQAVAEVIGYILRLQRGGGGKKPRISTASR